MLSQEGMKNQLRDMDSTDSNYWATLAQWLTKMEENLYKKAMLHEEGCTLCQQQALQLQESGPC